MDRRCSSSQMPNGENRHPASGIRSSTRGLVRVEPERDASFRFQRWQTNTRLQCHSILPLSDKLQHSQPGSSGGQRQVVRFAREFVTVNASSPETGKGRNTKWRVRVVCTDLDLPVFLNVRPSSGPPSADR
jgi:hypothetical protein